MNGLLIRRVIISIAFFVAVVCLLLNLAQGADLYYATFTALCVLFTSAIILLLTLRGALSVLARFMRYQHTSTSKHEGNIGKLPHISDLEK